MEFNSYIFVLAFLPLTLILYNVLIRFGNNVNLKKGFLILISLGFITYADYRYLLYLVISILVNYCFAKMIARQISFRKVLLIIGIILNVLSLGFFKYTGFILGSLNHLGGMDFEIPNLIVPLGISFVTFQQISYLVDVYKGTISSVGSLDYVFYITYFPKYVQGPISKYDLLVSQINEKSVPGIEGLSHGIWLFIRGLAMKVLLADVFANAVSYGWNNLEGLTSVELIIVSISFTFQIYFDFAGYSSMAIGISKMFGINLKNNFDSPYQSYSIIEFWKKWHISLTDFLREYIYIPLGGNRKGKVRTYINTLIIFLISGLWHGGAWTFVIWGAIHGIGMIINRVFSKQWDKMHKVLQWLITFSFVNLAWIFFRAMAVSQAFDVIGKMMSMQGTGIGENLMNCFAIPELQYLTNNIEILGNILNEVSGFGLYLFMSLGFILSFTLKDRADREFKPSVILAIWSIFIFSWSIISLSGVVEFIYAGF